MEENSSKKKKMVWLYALIYEVYLSVNSSEMAKKLANECKVPLYTFNNWRSGLVKVPELAKDKIEEVIQTKYLIAKLTLNLIRIWKQKFYLLKKAFELSVPIRTRILSIEELMNAINRTFIVRIQLLNDNRTYF